MGRDTELITRDRYLCEWSGNVCRGNKDDIGATFMVSGIHDLAAATIVKNFGRSDTWCFNLIDIGLVKYVQNS